MRTRRLPGPGPFLGCLDVGPMAGAPLIVDDMHTSGTPGAGAERARLRALVAADQGQAGQLAAALERVCRVAVEELQVAGAVVSLKTVPGGGEGPSGAIAAASGEWARSIDELEFSVGEGPGNDAFLTSRPVLIADLELAFGRWPGYVPAALAAGARSVFAVPMLVGAVRFGVLNLHGDARRSMTGPDVTLILLLAELATELVIDGFPPGAGQGHGAAELALLDGSDERDQIYQAQGMVMAQLGVSLPEALARLRAHSFASGQDLARLAADIVAGRARLPADPEEPG